MRIERVVQPSIGALFFVTAVTSASWAAPVDARRGAETELAKPRLAPKSPADYEREQTVSCNMKQARQAIEKLDRAFFHGQALRFAERFLAMCGARLADSDRAVLAVDLALVHSHKGDDVGCLDTLSRMPLLKKPQPRLQASAAFNRALCGGPCALDPKRCGEAAMARKKVEASRAERAKRRAVVKELCSECEADKACADEHSGRILRLAIPANTRYFSQIDGRGELVWKREVRWMGDLDGDGLGDFVEGHARTQECVGPREPEGSWTGYLACGESKFIWVWHEQGCDVVVGNPNEDALRDLCIDLDPDLNKKPTPDVCWRLENGHYERVDPN